MDAGLIRRALLIGGALAAVNAVAVPAPTAVPANIQVRAPVTTPAAIRFDGRYSYLNDKRNLIQDIESGADKVFNSLESAIGSKLNSAFLSGTPDWFNNLPSGSAVQSSLGIDDSSLAATPTQVLNVPPYANWTEQGWNVRFHGNVFKQPNISQSKIDDLANIFLIGTSIQDLPPPEQTNARNLTREIFVVQQANVNVTLRLGPATANGGNSTSPEGVAQEIKLPYPTTDEGDFDVFVQIKNQTGLKAGNETNSVQSVNVYTNGTLTGNATAYLVPNTTGLTFISDIDDILRVTKIWDPKQGLLNSFAANFTPWMNMPDIYANWSKSLPNDTHFHYLTTTPEQVTRNYMDFIYKNYPMGSFDTRPLNFSNINETLGIRGFLLQKIFETFPTRKFILIADTSNSDVMKDYPLMAKDFPNQVQCILLRNTSSTDPSDYFPYDTSGFQGLNNKSYMFFHVPDDLTGLDLQNGQCLNTTIPQNVTFSTQDEVLGIHGAGGKVGARSTVSFVVALAAAFFLVL